MCVAVPNRGMGVPDYVLARLAAERNYSFSTVSISELKTLAGGLDAMYLTPSAPHQMALFTGEMPVISPSGGITWTWQRLTHFTSPGSSANAAPNRNAISPTMCDLTPARSRPAVPRRRW